MSSTVREVPDLLAGEDLARPPQQSRSKQGRSRLVAAAVELLAAQGYAGTSIDQIAQRLRIPIGGFYQHFRSKRQLLLVVMQEFLGEVAGFPLALDPALDRSAAFRKLLEGVVAVDQPYFGACRAWQEAILADAGLAELQNRIESWSGGRLAAFFAGLGELPDARRDVDRDALARTIDRFLWHLFADSVRIPRGVLQDAIAAAAHMLAHALFRDATEV